MKLTYSIPKSVYRIDQCTVFTWVVWGKMLYEWIRIWDLLIMERGKRWEIKNKIEKVERKLKYMLSDDKSNLPFQSFRYTELWARSQRIVQFGRRGFKGKSWIQLKKVMVNSSVTMVNYVWNKEKKQYLEIWKINSAIKLLTPVNFFIKTFSAPPLARLK